MGGDDDPKIPYGWDPKRRRRVHINEVTEEGRRRIYTCEKCGERLIPALGRIQIHHFRHLPRGDRPCELRTVAGVEKYQREVRESPAEVAERRRSLQLILLPHPDTAKTELYGLLRTIPWEVVEKASELESILSGLSITGKGVLQEVDPRNFHPNRSGVLVRMDPESGTFEVNIESTSTKVNQSIGGTWRAEPLSDGDLFVGQPHRAERLRDSMRVTDGEFVFLLLRGAPQVDPSMVQTYSMGAWNVFAFEVEDATRALLPDSGVLDENLFHVDIIVPGHAHPGSETPIEARAGSICIAAILPPKNLNPEFEVIPVPLDEQQMVLVNPTVPGEPRFIQIPYPEAGSKRVNIHWGGRHRLVHLHTVDEGIETNRSLTSPILRIGVLVRGENRLVVPWEADNVLTLRVDGENLSGGLELVGPTGMVVDLTGRFPEESELPGMVNARELSLAEVVTRLEDWIFEGCLEASIDFDSLGFVRIKFETPAKRERTPSKRKRDLDFRRIKEFLEAMDPLPTRASWKTVRDVFGIPSGTSHSQTPGGTKKKVRRALFTIRRDKNED